MRLIDAHETNMQIVSLYNYETDEAAKSSLRQVMEIIQKAPTITLPPNDPLTVEDLREIYAIDPYSCLLKPVWIEIKRDMPYSLGSRCSGYDLIGIDDSSPDFAISICDRFLHMKSYGEYWLAYRRKPEEVTA